MTEPGTDRFCSACLHAFTVATGKYVDQMTDDECELLFHPEDAPCVVTLPDAE